MPYPASYVLIENIEYDDNVKIYYDNKLIKFSIISTEENQVKINLNKEYICDKLLFYVDSADEYTIRLYRDLNFKKQILSKKIENEKTSVPDGTWIAGSNEVFLLKTENKLEESDLTKLLTEKKICSYKEKYVYKYETIKEYYDNDYYKNVENYLKDINDFKIYYKGEPIVNTVEIVQEKTIEVPQIEYIYIEKDKQENDSSQQTKCQEATITETLIETKTEIVEKKITKIPKNVYLIILILLIVIVLLLIKLYKKYVKKTI